MPNSCLSCLFSVFLVLVVAKPSAANPAFCLPKISVHAELNGIFELVKGRKPQNSIRPNFKKAAAPQAKKRSNPSQKKFSSRRIRAAKLSISRRKLSVSTVGSRKLSRAIKPTSRVLARSKLTIEGKDKAIKKLRAKKPLTAEFSKVQIRNYTLRKFNGNHDKSANAIEHSLKSHGYKNAGNNKSKFIAGMSVNKLKLLTRITLRKGDIIGRKKKEDPSAIITYKFSKPVGYSQNGKKSNILRVIVRNNAVQSVHVK